MSLGLLFCILGAVSFGLLGCVSKLAERKQCNSSAVVMWMATWAAVFMLCRTLTQKPIVPLSWPVVWLAVGFGVCAVCLSRLSDFHRDRQGYRRLALYESFGRRSGACIHLVLRRKTHAPEVRRLRPGARCIVLPLPGQP